LSFDKLDASQMLIFFLQHVGRAVGI
jgi:hypothetical protein